MNDFKELEFKYKADDVKLQDFVTVITNLVPDVRLDTSSWDYYYTKPNIKEEFIRYREASEPELTKKRKVKEANNWERDEYDLPLDPDKITRKIVEGWISTDGYKENFRIYKSCFIFWVGSVNYVYYIVYDENMKEKGRFIEVEVNKKEVPKLGMDKAIEALKNAETVLTSVGITPQNRMKKSLFELFVKNEEK